MEAHVRREGPCKALGFQVEGVGNLAQVQAGFDGVKELGHGDGSFSWAVKKEPVPLKSQEVAHNAVRMKEGSCLLKRQGL